MQVLLVDRTVQHIEDFASSYLQQLPSLPENIDVHITTSDRLDRIGPHTDCVLFGPGLGFDAVALSERVGALAPESSLIIVVEDEVLSQGGFGRKPLTHLSAVLATSVALEELPELLLQLASGSKG